MLARIDIKRIMTVIAQVCYINQMHKRHPLANLHLSQWTYRSIENKN